MKEEGRPFTFLPGLQVTRLDKTQQPGETENQTRLVKTWSENHVAADHGFVECNCIETVCRPIYPAGHVTTKLSYLKMVDMMQKC